MQNVSFLVDKGDLSKTQIERLEVGAPEAGEVIVAIDKFAFTANNVTYGVAGDAIGYWQFFPAQAPWGQIPVWGFADVVESNHAEVPVGERLYGYFPMAQYLKMAPAQISANGLIDGSAHRAQLPPVYNQYTRVASEPEALQRIEDERALLFPLFATSYILFDFLQDNDFFQAQQVIIGSASSKTGLGLAELLHADGRASAIALTSPRNAAFVRDLGCYKQVLTYSELDQLDTSQRAVLVDMSGASQVVAQVHERFNDQLAHSCAVGVTHWQEREAAQTLAGPQPEFFFAPAQIEKRNKEMGSGVFMRQTFGRCAEMALEAKRWMNLVHSTSADAISENYQRMLEGAAAPVEGHIFSLRNL